MNMRIALAGNPNCGKTTLFNALTGSNQFVGNWPGVTVEKKEGKLKKHDGVTITDLPGIYSLSPYTLEEVVARNYLIGERPDAILNIIDGTNLERNLYLTTQLTELGIPVVVAINMMDVVEKNGDKINTAELSRQLGCKVVEISALKGNGTMEAAEAAVDAAKNGKTVPMHTFSGTVEHALAHIEEAAVHGLPEEQQRWYAIKLFERDDKVLEQLKPGEDILSHIETDIRSVEEEMDDDAESIITNERYIYIGSIIKGCLKKKSAGRLTNSDKIDRIVTNRFLGLPIFAVIMFLVYYISMVTVGSAATDWANDGLFGDGFHLLGIGSSAYGEAAEEYGDAALIVDGYDVYVEENGTAPAGDFPYEVADEENNTVVNESCQPVRRTNSLKSVTHKHRNTRNPYAVSRRVRFFAILFHHGKRIRVIGKGRRLHRYLQRFLIRQTDLRLLVRRTGWQDSLTTVLSPVWARFWDLCRRCLFCSCSLHSLKHAAIWRVSLSCLTGSSASLACPESPLSRC